MDFNNGIQLDWNRKRLDKLYSILGKDWFKGRTVLEVGTGHGAIGKELIELGADVTFTDARQEHLDTLPGLKTFLINQEEDWTIEGKFDLIIHWGVSYHLKNWRNDLRCALDHSNLICFETEIYDSPDPTHEDKVDEEGYDQAFGKIGSVVSASNLEAELVKLGARFKRYDDTDLNAGNNIYDWKEGSINGFTKGQRRFWMIRS